MIGFFSPTLRRSISAAFVLILIVFAGELTACSGEGKSNDSDDRIQVITTLPLFADFVRNIGGDRVEVTALLPSGSDPHTWEPAPSDVKRITEADVVFVNGLDLEPAAIKIIEANVPDGIAGVALGEMSASSGVALVPSLEEEEHVGEEGEFKGTNPHLWMNVDNAKLYSQFVRDKLSQLDEEGAADYETNYDAFVLKLDDVDAQVRESIEAIPSDKRKLVTTHDAFDYFAEYFDLEVVAVVAHSPGQEPSPEDIANLVRTIRDEGVPAVFGEPQVEEEGRILQQAAEDAGVEFCTLYSDSLDDRVTNYIELMRFNADELARCLGGP